MGSCLKTVNQGGHWSLSFFPSLLQRNASCVKASSSTWNLECFTCIVLYSRSGEPVVFQVWLDSSSLAGADESWTPTMLYDWSTLLSPLSTFCRWGFQKRMTCLRLLCEFMAEMMLELRTLTRSIGSSPLCYTSPLNPEGRGSKRLYIFCKSAQSDVLCVSWPPFHD